jgi:hypothetical protein
MGTGACRAMGAAQMGHSGGRVIPPRTEVAVAVAALRWPAPRVPDVDAVDIARAASLEDSGVWEWAVHAARTVPARRGAQ